MYEIHCEDCGRIGFHPSRLGAETRAEHHANDTGHRCRIDVMEEA